MSDETPPTPPTPLHLNPIKVWRGHSYRPDNIGGGYVPGTSFRLRPSGTKDEAAYIALPVEEYETLLKALGRST